MRPFVTGVRTGSDASVCGLRKGDQINSINGFHLRQAVHCEVASLVKNEMRLDFTVKCEKINEISLENLLNYLLC